MVAPCDPYLVKYGPQRVNTQGPSRGSSEPASGPGDAVWQESLLRVDFPTTLTVLIQKAFLGPVCERANLLVGDLLSPMLPSSDLERRLPLRRSHRDIYQTLRPKQACAALQCNRLGVSGPEGKHFRGINTGGSVLPAPEGPMVKFSQEKDRPDAPIRGFRNIPDDVLRSLVQKLSVEDEWADIEISQYMTDEYGGESFAKGSAHISPNR